MYLDGLNIVVIGGSSGIGAAIVRGAIDLGARVFFTYHYNRRSAEDLAQELGTTSKLIGYERLDCTDFANVETVLRTARTMLGRIDSLINTIGALNQLKFLVEQSVEEIDRILRVELLGVVYPIKVVLPWMVEQGYGRIVTVGSDSGKVGSKAEAVSAAARGGVIAFSKAVAREVAEYDICVNVVCPGPTDTELLRRMLAEGGLTQKLMQAMIRAIPKRRPARPEEVAAAALFLASREASYITGQAISVSGGLTMC
jgi:NAD(P)-dependent dehydrogenase (short-subunit alcohol dehydrogenase family)